VCDDRYFVLDALFLQAASEETLIAAQKEGQRNRQTMTLHRFSSQMLTHVSQGTSVVVARPDDSSDVIVNIGRLSTERSWGTMQRAYFS